MNTLERLGTLLGVTIAAHTLGSTVCGVIHVYTQAEWAAALGEVTR